MEVEQQVLDEVTSKLFSWEAPCGQKSKVPWEIQAKTLPDAALETDRSRFGSGQRSSNCRLTHHHHLPRK